MSDFELSARGHLAASPAEVWSLLTDFEAAPIWLERAHAVVGDEGGFSIQLAGSGAGHSLEGEIVEVEPQARLDVRLRDPSSLLRETEVRMLLGSAEEGTEFAVDVLGRLGPIGSLVAPLLRLRAEVELHRVIRGFRAAIEERSRAMRARHAARTSEDTAADA
jgi:uncharacterized protein YndB with AHSA1/START domain